MTRKDFEALAQAINDARGASAPPDIREATSLQMQNEYAVRQAEHSRIFDSLSRSIANVCAQQNARFQRARFLAACGVKNP